MGAVANGQRPPDWVAHLPRPALEDLFGMTTVRRAVTYQRRRAVLKLDRGPHEESLMAIVQGTRRYTTIVAPDPLGGLPWSGDLSEFDVLSECTCPVGDRCKHVVATILEAQDRIVRAPAGPKRKAAPRWEGLLDPVVEDPAATSSAAATPLGLLVEVSSGYPMPHRPGRAARPFLQLRPLIPGRSGGWVRTGISWSDLQYSLEWRQIASEHREALAAIVMTERIRSGSHFGIGQWITSESLGPKLWGLLDDALAAGVALVTGPRCHLPVVVCSEPASVVLDATRSGERGRGAGDIVLRPSLRLPGAAGTPVTIGSPPHGAFVQTSHGLTLARLARPLTKPLASLVDAVDTVTIPARDTTRFLTQYYPALRQRARLESSDGSVEFPAVQRPRLALTVVFEADHRTRLRWAFRYTIGTESVDVALPGAPGVDATLPGAARAHATLPGAPRAHATLPGAPRAHATLPDAPRADAPLPGAPTLGAPLPARDAAAEEALLASLDILDAAPGLRIRVPGRPRPDVVGEPTLQGWPTVAFVRDVLPALVARDDVEVTIVGTPLDFVEFDGPPVVSVSAQDITPAEAPDAPAVGRASGADGDWFDLGITVTVADREVPLASLLTALARGEAQLILEDGTWFTLDRPDLLALRRIIEEARALQDRESDQLRISRYQAGLWEELVGLGVVAHQSQRWERSVGALLALEQMPHPLPPPTLDATLRPYQLDGYRWLSFLWDHRLGGVLADDMGLGKTLQTLAMAERARSEGTLTPDAPMLVVAPTSVVAVWQREAATFTPGLSVATITQTVGRAAAPLAEALAGAHVVVTSYALFRIDAEHYTERTWGALVLDEAQFVKNHQSRTYQVARSLPAPVKLAITGTPLENSLMDLWSLLSITAPGLFPSPQRFSELFRKPIESGDSPELLATMRRRIRPLMLRRTKEAVAADLPPKVEQVVAVPLNASHRRIYDTHLQRERQRILGLLEDADRNRVAILTGLTRLRQLSLDVHLVVPDAPATVHSSKVDALLEQLVEVVAEGHRCLVFSQFTRFLQIVRKRLDAAGIAHVYLDGRTRDRPKRVAEFTDGDAPVFLISLKAGGSGLTLTEADYVFVLDPWWNPAVEAQAIDRTHRIGQQRTVMVYRLVSEGTIEEKVVALQQRKRDLFARVVDEGGLMGAALTVEDIRGLLEG